MAWEVWTRMRAAMIAARRAFLDPTSIHGTEATTTARQAIYLERWAYANSSAYDDLAAWAARYSNYGLYSKTRGIYNPTGRLCEFYEAQIYPGIIPQGDASVPDDAREALPMAPGISPELRSAVLQVAQWSNLQTQKDQLAYLGAALGDVGLEVVDDKDRGKVAFKLWWPGYVKRLELDDYGNVVFVSLEYQTSDGETAYTYRQDVSKETIATFKDDNPYSYEEDGESERPNPYGFVPFCWVRHRPLIGQYGEPAMRSTGKLDHLNSVVSRTLDYLTIREKAPFGIAADWDSKGLGNIDVASQRTNANSDEYSDVVGGSDGDDVFLMALPAGASGLPLAGNIEPEQALGFIDRMLTELEADNPELSAWAKLREMTGVSGVAIERALGDTVGRLYRTQAAYDQQLVKAIQMAVAIGGWRLSMGDTWQSTAARDKFAPFGLDSYAAGELDFMLLPRPLTPPTSGERYEAATQKYASIMAAVSAGLPLQTALVEAGYSDEEAEEIVAADEEKDARAMQSLLAARAGGLRPLGLPPAPDPTGGQA